MDVLVIELLGKGPGSMVVWTTLLGEGPGVWLSG